MPNPKVKYLLDTNIASVLLDNSDYKLRERLISLTQGVVISAITWGELWHGVYNSSRVGQNIARLELLFKPYDIIPCNRGTAQHYGILAVRLKRQGKALSTNDIWIAAIAIQHNLILVTRDKDFEPIEGLQREAW